MNLEQARRNMITQQARAWGVLDEDILQLLKTVPREAFVPEEFKQVAFADTALPLGHGQFMWTPKEEARVLQALAIQPTDKVLEIGTGSGYFTALLAKQATHVYSVDIFPEFITQAQFKLNRLGIENVTLHCGDAAQGWAEAEPYDVIVITGSVPIVPPQLQQQLAINGRLFAIVGTAPAMTAQVIIRQEQQQWQIEPLFETVVPPLYHALQPAAFNF